MKYSVTYKQILCFSVDHLLKYFYRVKAYPLNRTLLNCIVTYHWHHQTVRCAFSAAWSDFLNRTLSGSDGMGPAWILSDGAKFGAGIPWCVQNISFKFVLIPLFFSCLWSSIPWLITTPPSFQAQILLIPQLLFSLCRPISPSSPPGQMCLLSLFPPLSLGTVVCQE